MSSEPAAAHDLAGFPGLRLPLPTGGLELRRWEARDVDALVAIRDGDPEMIRWTPVPQPYTADEARATLAKWDGRWDAGTGAALAMVAGPEGEVVGEIDLVVRSWVDRTAEIAYSVAAPARGRGFATRALEVVRDAAVGLGFRRLVLQVEPGNHASWRLATRCGFRLEGIQRAAAMHQGRPVDLAILAYVVMPDAGTSSGP
ncbi:GNAT family protein [Patulibacter sp. NPDC049589]|uniref:GNAT family N-acetyltransferase n=1 Tax=Patulibacter sp. NPDC049589 TaxID=3154731 RepID=UPI0034234AC1